MFQDVLPLGGTAGNAVELGQGHPAGARRVPKVDDGVKSDQGDGQIRSVQGDTGLVGTQDGVHPSRLVDGGTTCAGAAFVACPHRRVAEVAAPGALQQIPADGGHVAQLRRRTRQKRLAQDGRTLGQNRLGGELLHRRQGPDGDGAVRTDHIPQRQPGDVDDAPRAQHPVLHEVHQRRATGEVGGARVAGHEFDGLLDPGGPDEFEFTHRDLACRRRRGSRRRCSDTPRTGRGCRS